MSRGDVVWLVVGVVLFGPWTVRRFVAAVREGWTGQRSEEESWFKLVFRDRDK